MTPDYGSYAGMILVLSVIAFITAIPLAAVEWRIAHESTAEDKPSVPYRHRQARDRFIEQNVSVTKFGDKRRITAPVSEFIKVETSPISFVLKDPNE